MRAEFEEKSYEQHLTAALTHSPRTFFPPGQVLEDILGFDVAIFSSNKRFWKLFPNMNPWRTRTSNRTPSGMLLKNEWWQRLMEEIEYLPKFKFNCFIQAKRPDRMVRSDASEYEYWKRHYFRYDTFSTQQAALQRLASRTQGKAIVTYACPTFYTYASLWSAIQSEQLVSQSNFCEVQSLSGHSRYSFVNPGNVGTAHSDPKDIEGVPFEKTLHKLDELNASTSNVSFLQETARLIECGFRKFCRLNSGNSGRFD